MNAPFQLGLISLDLLKVGTKARVSSWSASLSNAAMSASMPTWLSGSCPQACPASNTAWCAGQGAHTPSTANRAGMAASAISANVGAASVGQCGRLALHLYQRTGVQMAQLGNGLRRALGRNRVVAAPPFTPLPQARRKAPSAANSWTRLLLKSVT